MSVKEQLDLFPTANQNRSVKLHVRKDVCAMIDRAAAAVGGTRLDFMIDAARHAAEPALIGQTLALVDAGSYQHYLEVLDQPPGGKGSRA